MTPTQLARDLKAIRQQLDRMQQKQERPLFTREACMIYKTSPQSISRYVMEGRLTRTITEGRVRGFRYKSSELDQLFPKRQPLAI